MDKDTLEKLHKTELEILDEFVRICKKYNLQYFLMGGTLLGAVRHKGFIPWDDDIDVGLQRKDYEKFTEIVEQELDSKYMIDNKYTNPKYYLNFTKIRKKNTLFIQDIQENYDGPKGIWIDIFPIDEAKNDKTILTPIQRACNNIIFRILHYKTGIVPGKFKFLKRFIGKCIFIKNRTLLDLLDKILSLQNKNKDNKFIVSLVSGYGYKREMFYKDEFFPLKQLEFEGKKYNVPGNYKKVLENMYGDYMKLPPIEKRITHNPLEIKF